MGQSTDAILCFGIPLNEEDSTPEFLNLDNDEDDETSYDFDDLIEREAGLEDWFEEGISKEEKDRRWRVKHKTINDYPIDLIHHCSGNYLMYILAIRGTEIRSNRGDVTAIDPENLKVDQAKIDFLKTWCESHNVKWEDPRWYLVSMWN